MNPVIITIHLGSRLLHLFYINFQVTSSLVALLRVMQFLCASSEMLFSPISYQFGLQHGAIKQ